MRSLLRKVAQSARQLCARPPHPLAPDGQNTATAHPAIKETFKVDDQAVSLEGGDAQLLNQVLAAGLAIVLSVVATYVILKVVDAVIGLRVTSEQEVDGLDVTQHGEEAYAGA